MIVTITGNFGLGWHVQDLRRAAEGMGVAMAACSWRQLRGGVGAGHIAQAGDVVLDDAGCVLLRTMGGGSLEQIVFRMDLLSRLARSGVCVLNSPRAIEVAVDKYLALVRLHDAGLRVPATVVCQRAEDAAKAFEELGGDVLIKPLFGSEGIGITRITDPELAGRAFTLLERLGSAMYVQKFIPHDGADLRLFVLGGRVLASMRRVSDGWRTNIAQGGRGEQYSPTGEIERIALQAAQACDADMAGVDILIGRDGLTYVLEVNAVPGWRKLSEVTGIDVAGEVIRYACEKARG